MRLNPNFDYEGYMNERRAFERGMKQGEEYANYEYINPIFPFLVGLIVGIMATLAVIGVI